MSEMTRMLPFHAVLCGRAPNWFQLVEFVSESRRLSGIVDGLRANVADSFEIPGIPAILMNPEPRGPIKISTD